MSIAAHSVLAVQAPLAVPSTSMFAPGDEVESKNRMYPYWMTIRAVNERNGYCQCYFGRSSNYAGNFHHRELRFYGGRQYQQLAG